MFKDQANDIILAMTIIIYADIQKLNTDVGELIKMALSWFIISQFAVYIFIGVSFMSVGSYCCGFLTRRFFLLPLYLRTMYAIKPPMQSKTMHIIPGTKIGSGQKYALWNVGVGCSLMFAYLMGIGNGMYEYQHFFPHFSLQSLNVLLTMQPYPF